jgi:hypothetical protein
VECIAQMNPEIWLRCCEVEVCAVRRFNATKNRKLK